MTGYITHTLKDGVFSIELGRAPAHALSLGMIKALTSALRAALAQDDVRVVMLTGAGKIFCAGHDMKEIRHSREDADEGLAFLQKLFEACATLMQLLAGCDRPTIAVTEGVATAGGLQLLASCDVVFAAPSARFALPGVVNGGFCTTPSVAVSRKIAPGAVFELAYSGELMDADWALRTGLITRIVPQNDLRTQAMAFATTLSGRHSPAIRAGKDMLRAQMGMPLDAAYDAATKVMIQHFMDPHRIAKDKDRW